MGALLWQEAAWIVLFAWLTYTVGRSLLRATAHRKKGVLVVRELDYDKRQRERRR